MDVILELADRTFSDDAIISIFSKQTVDPIYGRLPEAEMVVQLYSTEPLYPQMEEKLTLSVNNWPVQTMFVKECARVGKHRYRLVAKPRTEYLQTRFLGNIYQNVQVSQVLQELFGDQAGRLDTSVVDKQILNGYIGPGTRSSALEQLCFGVGGLLSCGATGELLLTRPFVDRLSELTADWVTPYVSYKYLPHYTRYELVSHEYVRGEYEKVLMDREVAVHPLEQIFTNPHWYYVTDGEHQAEITEEGSNYVKIDHHGYVKLFAKPWLDRTQYHTLPGVSSDDPWFSHVLSVRDRTLIGPHNVQSRLQELKELGQLRCQVKLRCLLTDMGVAVRAGTPVDTPYGSGVVVAETLTLTEQKLCQELTILCKEA